MAGRPGLSLGFFHKEMSQIRARHLPMLEQKRTAHSVAQGSMRASVKECCPLLSLPLSLPKMPLRCKNDLFKGCLPCFTKAFQTLSVCYIPLTYNRDRHCKKCGQLVGPTYLLLEGVCGNNCTTGKN